MGSLFQQKTKAKWLDDEQYAVTCFHYIHQNPVRAELCEQLECWAYSSFRDYAGLRNGTLCNRSLAGDLIPIDFNEFLEESYRALDGDQVKHLYC